MDPPEWAPPPIRAEATPVFARPPRPDAHPVRVPWRATPAPSRGAPVDPTAARSDPAERIRRTARRPGSSCRFESRRPPTSPADPARSYRPAARHTARTNRPRSPASDTHAAPPPHRAAPVPAAQVRPRPGRILLPPQGLRTARRTCGKHDGPRRGPVDARLFFPASRLISCRPSCEAHTAGCRRGACTPPHRGCPRGRAPGRSSPSRPAWSPSPSAPDAA